MNDNNDVNNKYPHLTPLQNSMVDKAIEKKNNIRKLEQLTPNSEWTIIQDLIQEIQADYVAQGIQIAPAKVLIKELEEKIEKIYADEPERKEIILAAMPSTSVINRWYKLEGWNKAVWDKVKNDALFSKAKRAAMIDALYKRGLERDTVAAKLYLTMSGDYSDRPPDEKNSVMDTFREANKILHKKV